jgi:crossover junction endodeoxyribonuclease RusA
MIILKGNPLSTNHIYKRHGFTIYMSAEGKAIKEAYQWEITQQYKDKITYKGLEIEIRLFFGDKRKRDVDNHNKIILDAMTGIVYADDNQIQALHIYKDYDKENPRVEVLVIK